MKYIFSLFIFILFNIFFTNPCLSSDKFHEERMGTLQFGMDNGVTNTEIFPQATYAQQGIAYVKFKGKESLFITVRAAKKSRPDKGQVCRIVQFDFNPDGSLNLKPVCFTKLLPIGHGQGFGAIIKNNELYFYCQSHYIDDKKYRYKAVSRVRWRGADTNESDIEEIPLLPPTGDLSRYGFLTPNISTDGKYLVTLCSVKKGVKACVIWKMDDLKPYAEPFKIFPIKNGLANDSIWQGLCADDRHIYFVHGGIYAVGNHVIAIYDYDGNLIKEFLIEDEKSIFFEKSKIKTSSKFIPWNVELEGIAIRGKDLLITGVCTLSKYGDIVSWEDKNYACFKTTDGNILPNDSKYWIQTSLPANKGEFSSGVIYKSGRIAGDKQLFVSKYKYMYKIKNAVIQ